MKRHTIFIFILLFLVPEPVQALTPLSDTEMCTVTGRSGVSMVIDDMTIFQSITRLDYIDRDGENYDWYDEDLVGQAGPARIRLMGLAIDGFHVEALSSTGQIGATAPHLDPSQIQDITDIQFRPMTFDIATGLDSVFWNSQTGSRTGLLIGLPSLGIYIEQLKVEGIYLDSINRDVWDNHRSLTQIVMKGTDIAILDGRIGLMAHPGCGIDIGMDDIQVYIKIAELRFNDNDGLWNPINDVYQNLPQIMSPNDRAIPYSISIRDIEFDTLRINSLVFTSIPASGDDTTSPEIHSPGKTDAHAGLREMKNFKRRDIPPLARGFAGCPLQIDIGSGIPTATALDRANGGTKNITGMLVSLPTLEIFTKEISIEGIYVDDPLNDPTLVPVYNEDTSFTQVRIEDSLTAVMSGKLEIFAH